MARSKSRKPDEKPRIGYYIFLCSRSRESHALLVAQLIFFATSAENKQRLETAPLLIL
jgi:hypothetical protein